MAKDFSSRIKTLQCFLWGLIGPCVVLAFCKIFDPEIFHRIGEYPWRLIFTLGILASLWLQMTVHAYFWKSGYYKASESRVPEPIETFILPIVVSLLVLMAILKIDDYKVHVTSTLLYLLLIAAWDLWIWMRAESNRDKPENEARTAELKEACRQLFLHIDGAVFVVILLWVALLSLLESESYRFCFTRDFTADCQVLTTASVNFHNNCRGFLPEHVHEMRDPMLAGVVGCHMLLSLILLAAHLEGWTRGKLLGASSVQAQERSIS